jgi:outer membrane protein assembly factor BamE
MRQPRPASSTRHIGLMRPVLVCLALAASGCVYRMDIQQGNFLKEDDVAKLKVGMTRSQVRFLLGTPMVADSFKPDRWDYVYYVKPGKGRRQISRRHVVVYFAGDQVDRMERPDGDAAAAAAAAQKKKRNWFKFWKRQKEAAAQPEKPPPQLPPAS